MWNKKVLWSVVFVMLAASGFMLLNYDELVLGLGNRISYAFLITMVMGLSLLLLWKSIIIENCMTDIEEDMCMNLQDLLMIFIVYQNIIKKKR